MDALGGGDDALMIREGASAEEQQETKGSIPTSFSLSVLPLPKSSGLPQQSVTSPPASLTSSHPLAWSQIFSSYTFPPLNRVGTLK